MIKITDKLFRYTTSFNTDLGKKFRKIEQDRRAAAASSEAAEAAAGNPRSGPTDFHAYVEATLGWKRL